MLCKIYGFRFNHWQYYNWEGTSQRDKMEPVVTSSGSVTASWTNHRWLDRLHDDQGRERRKLHWNWWASCLMWTEVFLVHVYRNLKHIRLVVKNCKLVSYTHTYLIHRDPMYSCAWLTLQGVLQHKLEQQCRLNRDLWFCVASYERLDIKLVAALGILVNRGSLPYTTQCTLVVLIKRQMSYTAFVNLDILKVSLQLLSTLT